MCQGWLTRYLSDMVARFLAPGEWLFAEEAHGKAGALLFAIDAANSVAALSWHAAANANIPTSPQAQASFPSRWPMGQETE
jgi:hypothetical protein